MVTTFPAQLTIFDMMAVEFGEQTKYLCSSAYSPMQMRLGGAHSTTQRFIAVREADLCTSWRGIV
jgi:hypothetical protein